MRMRWRGDTQREIEGKGGRKRGLVGEERDMK